MSSNRTSTAFHEAGHAFASWKSRFRIKEASVNPDQESDGHVSGSTGLKLKSLDYQDPSPARLARLHERIVCLLAGRAAQKHHKPTGLRSFHASADLKGAFDILARIHTPNELKHVFRYLDARATNLVTAPANWHAIEHVARELLKRTVMTGQELESEICRAFKTSPPRNAA